jgi:pyruvate formate lyase activating enzyme
LIVYAQESLARCKYTMTEATSGLVFAVQRFSLHDGPGIRTTVFLKGCPLHCLWCHNPEAIRTEPELSSCAEFCIRCGRCAEACPEKAIILGKSAIIDRTRCTACGECAACCPSHALEMKGTERTVEEVLAEVLEDAPFFDSSGGGLTVSGGEPLLQHAFCHALLSAAKHRRCHTAVDTSGVVAWPILEKMQPVTDLFLYDIKAVSRDLHRSLTGVDNTTIKDNLARLLQTKAQVRIRIPIIPGHNDSPDEISGIGRFLAGQNRQVEIDLLPYHAYAEDKYGRVGRTYSLSGLKPPSAERLIEIQAALERFGLQANVLGLR